MITDINTELVNFGTSVAVGAVIGLIYTFLKSLRIIIKKQSVSDVFLGIPTVLSAVYLWQKYLCGYLRRYILLGMALGMILYFCTIGDVIFRVFEFSAEKIYFFLHFISEILLTTVKKLGKILNIYANKKSHGEAEDNEKSQNKN